MYQMKNSRIAIASWALLLALYFSSGTISNAAVIAQTSFDSGEGFVYPGGFTPGFDHVTTDSAHWVGGVAGTNYTATWPNAFNTGDQAALFGATAGQFVTCDPAGATGVKSVTFFYNRTGTGSGANFDVQWTTGPTTGSWTTVGSFSMPATGGPWQQETVDINQSGDVKIGGCIPADPVTIPLMMLLLKTILSHPQVLIPAKVLFILAVSLLALIILPAMVLIGLVVMQVQIIQQLGQMPKDPEIKEPCSVPLRDNL